MKLRQCRYALALARTLSFSDAGRLVGAAQPTLSAGIARLEEELGAPLFSRTTRTVSLTRFGMHMLPLMQALVDDADHLTAEAKSFHNPRHRVLRIGISPLVDMQWLNRLVVAYKSANPGVEVVFKECLLADLDERISLNALDLGLRTIGPIAEGLRTIAAYEDRLVYLPSHHPGTEIVPRRWHASALPDDPLILTSGLCGLNDAVSGVLESAGAHIPVYAGQAMNYSVIEEWAELGLGAGILPSAKVSNTAKSAGPLLAAGGESATFKFEWIYRPHARQPSHLQAFLHLLQSSDASLVC